jgi:hypothetical protein
MDCLDLRQMSGFKLLNELTGKRAGVRDDAWELLIPGWCGDVSPYGGDLLIASTNGDKKTRQILAAVPGAVVSQDADDGANIIFHADHFATVARILRLRKRRTLSEDARRRACDNLRPFPTNPVVRSVARRAPRGKDCH